MMDDLVRVIKLISAIIGAMLLTSTVSFAMMPLTPEEAAIVRRAGRNAPFHIQAEIVAARHTTRTVGPGCARIRVIVRNVFKGKERLKMGAPLVFNLTCVFPMELSYPDFTERFRRGRMIEAILTPDSDKERNLMSVYNFVMSIPDLSLEPQLRLKD